MPTTLGAAAADGADAQLLERDGVPFRAADLDGHVRATACVPQDEWRATLTGQVLVSPGHQRQRDREDVAALLGEDVLVPRPLPGLLVRPARQQPVLRQLLEPRRGDGLGDPHATREL